MRRRMQGVIEFLRLSRSKPSFIISHTNAVVDDVTPSSRPWRRLFEDDYTANLSRSPFSTMMKMRLAGPGIVHAAAIARGGGGSGRAYETGMEENGKPAQPQPTPSPPPPPPSPPRPPSPSSGRFSNWVRLVFGSMFSILLAFWMPKWRTILKIEGKADVVVHEIEQVAEVVEKVATVVEKVSEEVVDNLPNDTKIKEAAYMVERISKQAAKDALIAQELIHKIDDAKQDMEDVEEIVEPIIEKIVQGDTSKTAADENR